MTRTTRCGISACCGGFFSDAKAFIPPTPEANTKATAAMRMMSLGSRRRLPAFLGSCGGVETVSVV
ncbi:MAG: hypothetical protein HC888_12935 [Candidatus Competibacteraceae bacterium]|nr:hypothetical protein [Candidatus Competibacteraceae bacterium]